MLCSVELVFESAEAAISYYTDYSEIDLRPAIIHRKYNELLLQKKFAENVSSNVASATENLRYPFPRREEGIWTRG